MTDDIYWVNLIKNANEQITGLEIFRDKVCARPETPNKRKLLQAIDANKKRLTDIVGSACNAMLLDDESNQ